jgi:DNA-binding transcriptional LysR family regulator
VAVIPRLSVQPNDPRVAVVPIDPPLAPRRITLAWARSQSPAGPQAAFIEIAKETASQA